MKGYRGREERRRMEEGEPLQLPNTERTVLHGGPTGEQEPPSTEVTFVKISHVSNPLFALKKLLEHLLWELYNVY